MKRRFLSLLLLLSLSLGVSDDSGVSISTPGLQEARRGSITATINNATINFVNILFFIIVILSKNRYDRAQRSWVLAFDYLANSEM
jgi:hypothetical protein